MQFPTIHAGRQATGRQTINDRRATESHARGKTNAALWTVQGALALLFLFAGVSKLVMPAATLSDGSSLPVLFLRFIGLCETLGAIGLVLPTLLRIRPGLTPLAAAGLTIIMIGATVITIGTEGVAMAIMPAVVGLFAVYVAYGRTCQAPQRSRAIQS